MQAVELPWGALRWAVRLGSVVTLAVELSACAGRAAQPMMSSWEAPPGQQRAGRFWRLHWYERGLTNANPAYDRRFRINAPEAVLHPQFGRRIETRENGLMLIRAEEDLFQLTGAELMCELWGGHPGTANKRVTVNGRSTYLLPRVGTEEHHCTYSYPSIPLKLTDLVNGWNAFQFALDQGDSFWGHAMIDDACLRVALAEDHSDLRALGLAGFTAQVQASPLPAPREGFALRLITEPHRLEAIAGVDYQGWFDGYDENGNTQTTDWHGFTRRRRWQGHLGSASAPPFLVEWDTTMLPGQTQVAVRAWVRFRAAANLVFMTPAVTGLAIEHPRDIQVALYGPADLPRPFWSRAGQPKECMIKLDVEPARIQAAHLHVRAWTGGPGRVRDYFTLNGRHFPVAEGTAHEPVYHCLPVEPALLRHGPNTIRLLSDTEHHGIEILRPGPALAIRWQSRD